MVGHAPEEGVLLRFRTNCITNFLRTSARCPGSFVFGSMSRLYSVCLLASTSFSVSRVFVAFLASYYLFCYHFLSSTRCLRVVVALLCLLLFAAFVLVLGINNLANGP